MVLSADSTAAFFSALTTQRYWVDYAPSYNSTSDPYDPDPTDQQINSDMKALHAEGFRGLVTYTLLGTYADIPRIAKADGFQYVIAGIYYPNNPTEIAAAASTNVLPYTDAFVVGNEGLQDGRYTLSQLTTAIAEVHQATGKPVTTSEPGGQYYSSSPNSQALLSLGDWLFPNIDYFLFPGPR
jgi:exo-beta-1,3-glucanase (GH17 family)